MVMLLKIAAFLRWMAGTKIGRIVILIFLGAMTILGLRMKWKSQGREEAHQQYREQSRENVEKYNEIGQDVRNTDGADNRKWLRDFSKSRRK